MTKQPNLWQRALTGVNQALNQTFSGFQQNLKDQPVRTLFGLGNLGYTIGQSYKTGRQMNAPDPNIPDFYNPINAMQNTGLQSQPFSPSIPKGDFSTTVYDIQNTISPMQNTGLSYGVEEQAPTGGAPQATAPQATVPSTPTAPKVTPQTMPVSNFDYNSAPAMTIADMNKLKMQAEFSNYFTDPSSRGINYTSVAQRFNPLARHEAFIKSMNMAKYAGELNPTQAYEDAMFQQEMAQKLANMYQ